jgi:hypothetical protein
MDAVWSILAMFWKLSVAHVAVKGSSIGAGIYILLSERQIRLRALVWAI